ncbi:sialic acid-binding Ig-like lectin 6 [Xyrichtys novacula]|uniref:Sialic acid-binding Ig-like lectin 6 n=1 Tax=Xyrichtys novacula TaxID=13765 RepID=A0AAV1FP38_XYRNO|nr:sialic acid-binding Ig-like lectin 6 [Xyrichtys novacula]
MFVFIWLTQLLLVGGNNADSGAPLKRFCQDNLCISLSDGNITAQDGLCVVIPCSFSPAFLLFQPSINWFKCEPSRPRCGPTDLIYSSGSGRVLPEFKGRVRQLQPDLNQKDCSIIINDLTLSDSGSYQLRVDSRLFPGTENTFLARATVSVEALTRKPTVMIPPLTNGQQTTLSCTAPGLCSGSAPQITWKWSGEKENYTFISGKNTAFETEHLSTVSKRHSSTLTLNPSFTRHHNTEITCRVTYKNNITTEETVTLKVSSYPTILTSSKCEVWSEVLTCACISEGFPLPTIKWPLLENHTQFSVLNTAANRTIHSTFTLTVKDHSNTVVECVSRNEVGEVKQSLAIRASERQEVTDQHGGKALLPWAVAAVSLLLNVILIVGVVILWKKRKTVTSNQEDRTYMSLKKTERCPEYDVIHPSPN